MNLETLQVDIKARGAGELFGLAARMVQERPRPLLLAWALYSACILVGYGVLAWGLGAHPVWALTLAVLFGPVFSLPMITTAGHLVFTSHVRFSTVLGAALGRSVVFVVGFLFKRLLSVGLLLAVIWLGLHFHRSGAGNEAIGMMVLGLLALVVPSLFLFRSAWFLGPIVALEGAPVWASLRRARRFAAGLQGRASSVAFVVGLVSLYLWIACAALFWFMTSEVLKEVFRSLTELPEAAGYFPSLLAIAYAAFVPFVTLVWFLVYLDMRIRKEGWDLEIAFRTRAAQLERQRG